MTSPKLARFAVFAFFTIAGAAVTFWAVHIPYVEDKLNIPHSVIGSVLLVFGAGSLTAVQLVGHFVDKFGSRGTTSVSGVFLGLTMFLPGLATEPFWLAVSLYLMGIGVGATDVAMNAQAVEVEKVYERPIFSTFHSMWSFGGLIGATLGGIALSRGFEMQTTMTLAASATIVISIALGPLLLAKAKLTQEQLGKVQSKIDKKTEAKNQNKRNRSVLGYVWFLGAIAGSAAIVEGIGVDWSALHHARILDSSPAAASLALVVFTGSMGITRLFIDKVVGLKGRIFVIRFGSLTAAIGTLLVVFSADSALALAGWVIAGVGIAGVVPQIFAYSAEIGEESHTGRNMAKVVGTAYAGILAGPALIGFLTELVPLNVAIGLGAVLGLFTATGTIFLTKEKISNAKAI